MFDKLWHKWNTNSLISSQICFSTQQVQMIRVMINEYFINTINSMLTISFYFQWLRLLLIDCVLCAAKGGTSSYKV